MYTLNDEVSKRINKHLDKIDEMLSDKETGEYLYQILSGSLRGPDNGEGKSAATQPLRRICFPKTCTVTHSTGMMNSAGEPTLPPGVGLSHWRGHVSHAISYLAAIGRIKPTDVKKEAL